MEESDPHKFAVAGSIPAPATTYGDGDGDGIGKHNLVKRTVAWS